jgi:hypothetical protein
MDKKTELAAYLAECNYRLKNEKSRGEARRTLLAEIKATKRRSKVNDKEIAAFTAKAARRSKKTPSAAGKFAWFILLVVLIAAVVAAVMFSSEIMAFLASMFPGLAV